MQLTYYSGHGQRRPMLTDFRVMLRSLTITAPKRVAAFADLTTAAEAGLHGYEVSTW